MADDAQRRATPSAPTGCAAAPTSACARRARCRMWRARPTTRCASSPSPQLLDEAVARARRARRGDLRRRHGAALSLVRPAAQRATKWPPGLLALGIRRGNRVGIWAPNRVEWLLAQFGTARIGAILVNINPAYRSVGARIRAEQGALPRADHGALAAKPATTSAMLRALAPELDRPAQPSRLLESRRLPHLKHVVVDRRRTPVPARAQRFDDFMRHAGPAHTPRLPALCRRARPGRRRSTSSSPAAPPARPRARRCRTSTSSTTRATAPTRWRSPPTTGLCIPVPLYHCFGMVLGVLACVASGATMVFPGESFDAGQTLRAVAAPPLHRAARRADDVHRHARASRRSRSYDMTHACAPASWRARRARSRRCGAWSASMHMREVTIAYGMTETSPISFQSGVDDPLERRVVDRRPHPSACRGEDRRRRRAASCRSASRASCARAATR